VVASVCLKLTIELAQSLTEPNFSLTFIGLVVFIHKDEAINSILELEIYFILHVHLSQFNEIFVVSDRLLEIYHLFTTTTSPDCNFELFIAGFFSLSTFIISTLVFSFQNIIFNSLLFSIFVLTSFLLLELLFSFSSESHQIAIYISVNINMKVIIGTI